VLDFDRQRVGFESNLRVESSSKPIVNSSAPRAAGELLALHSSYTAAESARLFESASPLLRENPYALAAPLNTMRARRSDWRVFIRFCAERHYTPLPAAPVVVREFLEANFGAAENKSVATVERYLSTIAHAHTLADLPDPTKTAHVKGAYRHLSRGRPSSQPKAALRGSHITHALVHLKTDHAAWDLRAKALLSTAYCTMARRAELVALRVADLSFNAEAGDGVALIRNTKAGREESRYLSAEAVTWLKAWLTHAEVKEGAVFRRFTPRGAIGQSAIAPQEVAKIVQRVGKRLNAQPDSNDSAWPSNHISAHSTRIGAAHDLAASGIDLTSIMHSGGWNDPKMPRYYTRELAAQESGMARMMKARWIT
jgi:site-specific recombinase XerD